MAHSNPGVLAPLSMSSAFLHSLTFPKPPDAHNPLAVLVVLQYQGEKVKVRGAEVGRGLNWDVPRLKVKRNLRWEKWSFGFLAGKDEGVGCLSPRVWAWGSWFLEGRRR